MKSLVWWLSAALVYSVCPDGWYSSSSEESEEDSAVIPFAGTPRDYGLTVFPPMISMYYTGDVNFTDRANFIQIANEQYDNGRPIYISASHSAVHVTKATDKFGVRVRNVDSNYYSGRLPGTIVERHPGEVDFVSTPNTISFNTSHPNLAMSWKSMMHTPGNFRVRIGNVKSCNIALEQFVPWGEFGFSTLNWTAPGPIRLVSVTSYPQETSFAGWPKNISLQYSAPIAVRDIRQIRYEVTPNKNPKQTFVFRFDRLVPTSWRAFHVILIAQRRLLSGPVPSQPHTPCLPFCEVDPSSPACQVCCTTVIHEKAWSCGEDSSARCCKEWHADCWDTPSGANLNHSCNMCIGASTIVRSYEIPPWMFVQNDTVLVIDHETLAFAEDFGELRKVLLHSDASVKLVIERGSLVDAFSQSIPGAAASWTFQVTRQPKELRFPMNGRSIQKFPAWINFTVDAPVTWRCATEIRGFGIQHKALAGGDIMRPGDLCRFPVVRSEPPPQYFPSTSSPTKTPSTPFPTRSPNAAASPATPSPTSLPTNIPTFFPTTGYPSPAPTAPTPPPTNAPTLSPSIGVLAPQSIPCDRDAFWPEECPYPLYVQLLVVNGSTTIAVDTQSEFFHQDFKDLDKTEGEFTVSLESFSLVTTDGASVPVVAPAEKISFVVSPTNYEGVALTDGGLRIPVDKNFVIIPAMTINATAVIEATVIPPPKFPNIPIPTSDVIRIVIFNANKTVAKLKNLVESVQLFLPIPEIIPVAAKKWSPCQGQVYYHSATCVWWDEPAKDWSTSGCTTSRANTSQIQCDCNHLTDFAVLQALESCQEVDPLPYYVFAGPFFCVFLYCLWALVQLALHRKPKKAGWNPLFGQHALMAIAAMTRALGPLAILPGIPIAATSALFALPYLAKFPSFLLLIVQWATIVMFPMNSGGGRKFIMPAFAVLCILIDLVVAAVFIYFHANEAIEAILIGTITLAALAGVYAIAFLIYGYLLARSFPKELSSSQGGTSSNKNLGGVRFRVQLGGFLFALFFIIEAICHPIALYLQQEQNFPYGLLASTSLFLLTEFLSYVLVLWLFYPALQSLMKTAQVAGQAELARTTTQSKLGSQKSLSQKSLSQKSISQV